MSDEPTVGEISRGLSSLSEQIHRLHEETMSQHHRVRNDMAVALGTIQTELKAVSGQLEGHKERLHAHGREIGALTKDVDELRGAQSKLLWSIIGAYGLVSLAVIGFVLGKL